MKPSPPLLFSLLAGWIVLAPAAAATDEPHSWAWLANVLDKPAQPSPLPAPVSPEQSAPPAALALCLKSETLVDSQGVFLDQIVGDDPGAALPHFRLADAPAFGHTLMLTRPQIAAALRFAPNPWTNPAWTGVEAIRISRRSRLLPEAELKELLRSRLQQESVRNRGELELRLARSWKSLSVPDEPLELRVCDLPEAGVTANFILRFELSAAKEALGSWQQVVQARVWREVLTTRCPIKRGMILGANDVLPARIDILTLRDALAAEAPDNGTWEWTENLPAGSPVYARSLRLRALVHRGDLIAAMLQEGTMTISLKVEVLEEGAMGQSVRVRNPVSKREFRGKVQNEQTILVSM